MAGSAQQQPRPTPRHNTLRLQEFDYSSPEHVYFLTIRACSGVQLLTLPGLAQAIQAALLWRREQGQLRLYAYCLMPDHLHMALSPLLPGRDVPHLLQAFKSYTTRRAWTVGLQGPLWQRSYYDHIARKDEDCRAICQYILDNPVRKGLVSEAQAWPYSGLPDPLPG
ncbi:MAG: transposase [Chloroflexi bacterium]|nr:transposase [Chloroflexota bacterium]